MSSFTKINKKQEERKEYFGKKYWAETKRMVDRGHKRFIERRAK